MSDIIARSEPHSISFRQHPTVANFVVMLVDGKYVTEFPHQTGLEIAKALYEKCKLVENECAAGDQILQQATLMRAGVPIGLGNNPKLYDEAKKEAVHNRVLRRSNLTLAPEPPMTRARFGIPMVTNHFE